MRAPLPSNSGPVWIIRLSVAVFDNLPGRALAASVVLIALLAPLVNGVASAVELRDSELVAAGSPVLQNGSGAVRLEDGRLGRVGSLFFVPEPGAFWQLGYGIGLLAFLSARRRHRFAGDTPAAQQRRRMP
jgi:hypothetical protein